MSMQDPISDMLTRVRNAQSRRHQRVEMPFSTIKLAIARVLKEQGYIKDAITQGEGSKKCLVIDLKYYQGAPVIARLERASRPSVRYYAGKGDLPSVDNGLGVAIISTSQGVMSDEAARKAGQGGEVLCYVS